MAVLTELQIQHFRNLDLVKFEPSPHFNFIYGKNASGKTSLLEAIYLLSVNRSFRTNNLQYLIQNEEDALTVFSRLLESEGGELKRLGLSRHRSKTTYFKIDGESVHRASELALLLPAIAIQPASFELIDGSPSYRRSFLDWLVFHVKQEFLQHSRNYHRILKQRNILLRSGKIDRDALLHWDKLMVEAARGIEKSRASVLRRFSGLLNEVLEEEGSQLSGLHITLEYKSGWGKDHSSELSDVDWFEQRLSSSFAMDLARGSTQIGSHRYDLKIMTKSGGAREFLSRGQKKTLILAMYLCSARHLLSELNRKPVFLLDDLPSELDEHHLGWLCKKLTDLNLQVFVTSVDDRPLVELPHFIGAREKLYKKFHVKHGSLETME